MIETEKIVGYKAFGLTISSEFPLPELPQIEMERNQADVVIKKAELSGLWSQLANPKDYFVKEDSLLFRVPDTATYLIRGGREILVSPLSSTEDALTRLYILGSCMGVLLMQKKVLPLHGSAIAIEGKAYAVVGDSGAGKSTLASMFLRKGYKLLSDDVIPVTLNENGIPVVTPAYPQQKLWLESLNQFGMDHAQYRSIYNRETKYSVPVISQFENESLPLVGIFELSKTNNNEITIKSVKNGLRQLDILYRHTYRNLFIPQSGLLEWHFDFSTKICREIELFQLHRPISQFTAGDLLNLILATIKKEEKIYD